MATTVYKGAYLPTVSGDSGVWGTLLNTATFPVYDNNLGGIVTKTLSNSNITLNDVSPAHDSQMAILRLIGTLTAAVEVTTACAGFTFVENATTGAFAVTYTNGVGTPVTIPQGLVTPVITDSTYGARIISPPSVATATTSVAGIVQLATSAETITGTNDTKAVTPADLASLTGTASRVGLLQLASTAEAITGTDTAKALTAADLEANRPARAYAEYATNGDLTVAIPLDDTIPQITEGTQILSASITPKRTTNRVRVTFSGQCSSGYAQKAIAALFVNSGANAVCAEYASVVASGGALLISALSFVFEHCPATTSSTTYSIRVGAGDSGAIRMNGSSTARLFGGASLATLVVEEIFA